MIPTFQLTQSFTKLKRDFLLFYQIESDVIPVLKGTMEFRYETFKKGPITGKIST